MQALRKSFQCLRDVGVLTVKVFEASGLAAADIGGKSDPFCVLELVNARLQVNLELNLNNPIVNMLLSLPNGFAISPVLYTMFSRRRRNTEH